MLFASSEAVPFAKTGGLGDVAGSLPRALKHAGARAAVIMPKYASIPQEYKDQMKHVADFYVPLAWRNEYCGIEKLTLQDLDEADAPGPRLLLRRQRGLLQARRPLRLL